MNTLALILTVVVTNWTSIGEFTDKTGAKFDVHEGRVQTNTVARIVWGETIKEGRVFRSWGEPKHTNEFILKSVPGPLVGERRLPIIWINTIRATNIYWLPGVTITNTPVDLRTQNGIIMNAEDLK